LRIPFLPCLIIAAVVGSANASTITYVVPGEASATVTTSLNTISISLTDLFVNPLDVAENLSAFLFTLSSAPSSASVASASGSNISVNGDGTHTAPVLNTSPGWVLSLSGSTTTLDVLSGAGHAGPADTLIGSPNSNDIYSNANGSIAGNGAHNPFLAGTLVFTLNELGVTSATTVTSAVFQFGTTDGSGQIPGTPSSSAPEPSSWMFLSLATAMMVVGAVRRKIRVE
jgi:hypothetical protein